MVFATVLTGGAGLALLEGDSAVASGYAACIRFCTGAGIFLNGLADPNPAAGGLPTLRQAYVDGVAGLAERAASLRAAGQSSEAIARELSAARRAIGVTYKSLTPASKLAEITERNIAKYGDPFGLPLTGSAQMARRGSKSSTVPCVQEERISDSDARAIT